MLSMHFNKNNFIFGFAGIFAKFIGALCLNLGSMVHFFTYLHFFFQYFPPGVFRKPENRKLTMILSARSGKYYLIKPRY